MTEIRTGYKIVDLDTGAILDTFSTARIEEALIRLEARQEHGERAALYSDWSGEWTRVEDWRFQV